jgi:hypothetical protein
MISLLEYAYKNYDKIDVQGGNIHYNFRCHLNAVHYAIENNDDIIVLCITVDNFKNPFVHFINYTNEKYIDNTLGHWSKVHEYYFVKKIQKEYFFEAESIFLEYRKYLKLILGTDYDF